MPRKKTCFIAAIDTLVGLTFDTVPMPAPPSSSEIAPAGNAGADPIEAGLKAMRRLRRVATALLLLATALFAAATWKEPQWPWLGFVAAFAEAAMVGAIADWFALTALFRRPLGLPIPYTAIIPRNQVRIARAIGGFVSTNLLAAKAAAQRLIELDPAGRLGKWLSAPGTADAAARQIVEALPPLLDTIDDDYLHRALRAALLSAAETAITPSTLADLLALAAAQGCHRTLLDQAIDPLRDLVRKNQAFIRKKVAARCDGWVPAWIEERIAGGILDGIVETLVELKKPNHPLRGEFDRSVRVFIERLTASLETARQMEAIKADILANPAVEAYLLDLQKRIHAWTTRGETLETIIRGALTDLARNLQDDPRLRAAINAAIESFVEQVIVPKREAIGSFIESLILKWKSDDLVRKIEAYAGKDLQYIRINGTVVGGLAGLTIYALTQLFK